MWSALTVEVAPSSVSASISNAAPTLATTNAATATPAGALGPVTYLWTVDNGDITINSPTSATTTFSATVGPGGLETGTATCTATDGVSEAQDTCTVNLLNSA